MTRAALACAAVLAAISGTADLTKVDADGVTAVGGSPRYARMLALTDAAGKLDASLLPPVSDWATAPIPGLYYVAGGAAPGGNGSAQRPFATISAAAEAAKAAGCAQTAVVLAPGAYADTVTPSGRLVILGAGAATPLTLAIEADGTSPVVALHDVFAESLTADGGAVRIELHGSRISRLSGTSSGITVARLDMGSRVEIAESAYTDVYAGHPTALCAKTLVSDDAIYAMQVADGRARVGDRAVAYVDDVTSATSTVHSAIGIVAATASGLENRLKEETDARKSGDTALEAAMSGVQAALETSIGKVGDGWNSQIEALAARMAASDAAVSALAAKETNDVHALRAEMAQSAAGVRQEGDDLAAALRYEFESGLQKVEDSVENVADKRFSLLLDSATSGIIDDAVAQLNERSGIPGITDRLRLAVADITALWQAVGSNTTDAVTLRARATALATAVTDLEVRYTNDVSQLTSQLSTLSSGSDGLAARVAALEATAAAQTAAISNITDTVNAIIDCLNLVKSNSVSSMTLPAKLQQPLYTP